jgi:DNA (cytosine-5)-methyltransferase 1
MNYYNEFDPFAAEWLKELIKDGLISPGEVDDRSILDVEPKDLRGFNQHHFFAGIGGWSYALRLAGWDDDRPVCTASLPCQPFSTAGKQLGKDDERHLLPHFMALVKECGFDTNFGEQVENAVRLGWLDDLQTNMEAEGYACGYVVLGAHSVGALHKRQRIYWISDKLADSNNTGQPANCRTGKSNGSPKKRDNSWRCSEISCLGDSFGKRQQGICRSGKEGIAKPSQVDWQQSRRIYCSDKKYRLVPTQSEVQPLANGISNRVGILRGAGNAIVPQVAAEVIKAFMAYGNEQTSCSKGV